MVLVAMDTHDEVFQRLRTLKQQVDAALSLPNRDFRPHSDADKGKYQAAYGSYDFIIGDFAITDLKQRQMTRKNPDWIKA